MSDTKRRSAFFAGRAMGRNGMTKVEVPKTMRRLKPPARKFLAKQLIAKWRKHLVCKSGEWNCGKILEEVERQLREKRLGKGE